MYCHWFLASYLFYSILFYSFLFILVPPLFYSFFQRMRYSMCVHQILVDISSKRIAKMLNQMTMTTAMASVAAVKATAETKRILDLHTTITLCNFHAFISLFLLQLYSGLAIVIRIRNGRAILCWACVLLFFFWWLKCSYFHQDSSFRARRLSSMHTHITPILIHRL